MEWNMDWNVEWNGGMEYVTIYLRINVQTYMSEQQIV